MRTRRNTLCAGGCAKRRKTLTHAKRRAVRAVVFAVYVAHLAAGVNGILRRVVELQKNGAEANGGIDIAAPRCREPHRRHRDAQ